MIQKETLDTALRESLEDRRLSREERHQIKAVLGPVALSADERAFVRNRVFALAETASDLEPSTAILAWAHDVIKAVEANRKDAVQMEVCFSPGDDCLATIQRLLRWSQSSADICVFTITDNRVSEAILECAKRGVKVRVISDNDKSGDTGSDLAHLRQQGIEVRLDRSEAHMHHKFAIFDNAKALTGSYNWTRSAATSNRENILVSDDPRAVDAFASEFTRLWKAFS
jgi:phosphatidylserine/phosphatidylglycerophosphate/cardiolipin synthase-like enzyme